jgi:acetyltransferase
MSRILAYARHRGIGEIHGKVLQENQGMLALCHDLGFSQTESVGEPGVVEVRLTLS